MTGTTGAIIAAIATLVASAIGAWATVKVRRLNRKIDDATVRRTDAEAATFEVKIARDLLTDVKTWSEQRIAYVRDDYESRIAALRDKHEGELDNLRAGQAELRAEMRALRAAFAAHETWDRDAVAALRIAQPDWPDPPPIPRTDPRPRRRDRVTPEENDHG